MAVVSSMKTLFFVMLLCFISGGNSYLGESECLKVPVSEFAGTLRSTLGVVGRVVSTVSKFSGAFSDFRLNNAVADCLDLMDFSVDQLSWTLAASQNPNGKDNSTGNAIADMNTWLSGNGQSRNVQRRLRWYKRRCQSGVVADAVVAADGTGNFTSIEEAVHAAPDYSSRRYVIYIKKGVYKEYVEISKKKWNIMMIGDGMDATVISGNRNYADGWTTYRTATFAVRGQGFIARDMTIENTAGPEKHQAVAFRSDSDLSVLYRCAFRGHQDTLYAHSMRQFYRECKITGTVDFMFGDGTAVFQNCDILARKGLANQKNTITAQGRKEQTERTGFSIQFCNISAEPDNSNPTYLGRPWKLYSRTVIMQSYISNAIRPRDGWNGMGISR
ncbi:Pectinesterase/pectinesterase inhibitor PPE8B [Sesamum angolense]|uniref:Pectinesterase n=1 Tax=Sesamum angolense TaxID=2727404 RepID=A0AAE1WNV0_9LAMI|nr:Pectinesterase/pectinesterase inhibitor PPE8B [Sesamum angolense]